MIYSAPITLPLLTWYTLAITVEEYMRPNEIGVLLLGMVIGIGVGLLIIYFFM